MAEEKKYRRHVFFFLAEPYTFAIDGDKFTTAYKLSKIEKVDFFFNLHKNVNFWSMTATVQSTPET